MNWYFHIIINIIFIITIIIIILTNCLVTMIPIFDHVKFNTSTIVVIFIIINIVMINHTTVSVDVH